MAPKRSFTLFDSVECMAELVRWFVAVGGGTAVVMVIRELQ